MPTIKGREALLQNGNTVGLFGPHDGKFLFVLTLNEEGKEPKITEVCVSDQALVSMVRLGFNKLNELGIDT